MKCVVFVLIVSAFVIIIAEETCNVISMTEWAGEASHRVEELPRPVSLVVIQHTVTPDAATDAECEGLARAVRKYHMQIMKFDDIAQSFLVCGNGKVYEGAGWTRVGAHTKGLNNKAVGVSFIGDFSAKLPTAEAIKAALDLLSCGVKNSYLQQGYKVVGHRQVSKTQSPGDELQKEIEKWPQWSSQ